MYPQANDPVDYPFYLRMELGPSTGEPLCKGPQGTGWGPKARLDLMYKLQHALYCRCWHLFKKTFVAFCEEGLCCAAEERMCAGAGAERTVYHLHAPGKLRLYVHVLRGYLHLLLARGPVLAVGAARDRQDVLRLPARRPPRAAPRRPRPPGTCMSQVSASDKAMQLFVSLL